MDGRSTSEQATRLRRKKLRMPGGDISVPTHMTSSSLKEEWNSMISRGELSMGEPCCPTTLKRQVMKDGQLLQEESIVYGRKFALLTVRKELLAKHEQYMYLHTDEELNRMNHDTLIRMHEDANLTVADKPDLQGLRENLKKHQRTRAVGIWHDHSEILGKGYIMITAKVFYDSAVFKSVEGKSIQSLVEGPEMHLLAISSSSLEDQAGVINDRLQCINEMDTPLSTSTNIPIKDRLLFFTGDKPAAQFERGTQMGGHFPCGSCGVHIERMDDFTHCSTSKWRSLADIQTKAIQGNVGKRRGCVKPFEGINKDELQKEIEAIHPHCKVHGTKSQLITTLKNSLRGIQRVPSLLIHTPSTPIQDTNLSEYSVLDCEPLHDLKGHLANILTELPSKINNSILAQEIRSCLAVDIEGKTTKRGGDYRIAAIHIAAILRQATNPPEDVLQLMESIVEISELLYADDTKRTPKAILRMFNITWLHFELCVKLFSTTTTISHRKMFGIYLHSLVHHAPYQYQILSLRSANTEHEERLFGQAKDLVHNTTNRQPHTILPNLLLRLQAKRKTGSMFKSFHDESSRVSKAASDLLHSHTNTTVADTFLVGRINSWLAHLRRISSYLVPGHGVWWKRTSGGFVFFDGSSEPSSRSEGPALQHFRNTTLNSVYKEKEVLWQGLIDNNTDLPALYIKLFSKEGRCVGRQLFYYTDTAPDKGNQPEANSPEENSKIDTAHEEDNQADDDKEQDVGVADEEATIRSEIIECTEDAQEENSEHQETPQVPLHTQLGKALVRVLGISTDIINLDIIRHTLKSQPSKTNKTHNRSLLQENKKLMGNVHKSLLAKKLSKKREITAMEQSYYITHGMLPNAVFVQEYKNLLRDYKMINKLVLHPDFK